MYENEGPVALGVKGVVASAKDGIGPLCEVVVVETTVAQTNKGRLGYESLVVTIVVGIEEFLEEVATFVSIVAYDTVWHL